MRGLKKVVASTLAVALLSASVGAFAAIPEDVAGTRYEEAVQILSALKIMIGDENGKYRPDDTIIRSEVTKMAVHALGLEQAAEVSKGETKFPDMGADHWANGYVNVATSQGIIIGDDQGNFRPNDKITYAEAMTIMVRVLGYKNLAEQKGGFPSGYIIVGSDNGLDKSVQGTINQPISRGNVAMITSNALTVKLMEQTGVGNNASYEVVDKTLLKDKLDVTKAEGQIVAIQHAGLQGDSNLSEGQVKIGDTVFDTTYNMNNLLGQNVNYYYQENQNTGADEIILAMPQAGKNATQTIKADLFEGIVDKNGDRAIEFYNNESDSKTTTATLADNAVLIYNGKYEPMSEELLNLKDKSGNIVLLDTTRSGKYNIAVVTEYQNMVVEEVTSSGKIVDKYGLPTLKLDEDVDYTILKYSKSIDVSALKEYDVLSIAASKDKELYNIVVTNDSVEGKITQVDDEGVYIGGKLYKIASNYNEELSLTTEGVFYLDVSGKIAATDTAKTISSNYAYLLRAYAAVDADEKVTFKVFTKDGEEKTLEAAEKIRFNGVSGQYAKNVVTNEINDTNGNTEKQLITFDVNAEGKLVKLNTAVDNTQTGLANENEFTKNYVLNNSEFNATLNKVGNVKLDNDTVIFDISDDNSEYSMADLKMFEDGAKYNVVVYDRTEDFTAKAIIVTNASFQTNAESPISIVQKVATATNSDDEISKKVFLMQDGKEIELLAEDDDVILKGDGKELQNGDVIQYNTNSKGEIATVRVLLNIANKTVELEGQPAENLEVVYGQVTKKFTSSVNLTVNNGEVKNIQIPKSATIYSIDTTKTKSNIEVSTFGDIQAYDSDEGNRLFVKIYKDVVQEVVIIK